MVSNALAAIAVGRALGLSTREMVNGIAKTGCYCTTMILSLIDSKPITVKAVAEMNEDGADLYTAAMIKFENGVRAAFNVGMILGENTNDRMDRLYIRGEKGCIKSSVEYNQEGELSYTVIADGKEITRSVTARQNYCLELERMNKAITGTEEILVTPEFSIRNAKLIDEALKAIGY